MLFLRALLSLFQSPAPRRADLPAPPRRPWHVGDYGISLLIAGAIVVAVFLWFYRDVTRPNQAMLDRERDRPRAAEMQDPESVPVTVNLVSYEDTSTARPGANAAAPAGGGDEGGTGESAARRIATAEPIRVDVPRPEAPKLVPVLDVPVTPPTALLAPELPPLPAAAPAPAAAAPAPSR